MSLPGNDLEPKGGKKNKNNTVSSCAVIKETEVSTKQVMNNWPKVSHDLENLKYRKYLAVKIQENSSSNSCLFLFFSLVVCPNGKQS